MRETKRRQVVNCKQLKLSFCLISALVALSYCFETQTSHSCCSMLHSLQGWPWDHGTQGHQHFSQARMQLRCQSRHWSDHLPPWAGTVSYLQGRGRSCSAGNTEQAQVTPETPARGKETVLWSMQDVSCCKSQLCGSCCGNHTFLKTSWQIKHLYTLTPFFLHIGEGWKSVQPSFGIGVYFPYMNSLPPSPQALKTGLQRMGYRLISLYSSE